MTSDDPTLPYDPELPILAELESAWHTAAARVTTPERATPSAAPAPVRSRTRPRREPWRAVAARGARRAGLLTGLGCLVAASAVATRSLVAPPAPDPTLRTGATVRLAAGRLDGQPWFLDAYRRDRQLCHDLLAGRQVATACAAPPPRRGLQVDGTRTATTRVVVGYAGASVARVRLRGEGHDVVVPTHPLPAAASASAGRATAPPGGTAAAADPSAAASTRWFVALLPRAAAGRAAATGVTVTARDAAGRRLSTQRVHP